MAKDGIHSRGGLSFIEAGLQSPKHHARTRPHGTSSPSQSYDPLDLPEKKPSPREITLNALLLAEKELIALVLRIQNIGGLVPENISGTLKAVQHAIRVNQGTENE